MATSGSISSRIEAFRFVQLPEALFPLASATWTPGRPSG
jgi:hypothetical protein